MPLAAAEWDWVLKKHGEGPVVPTRHIPNLTSYGLSPFVRGRSSFDCAELRNFD